MWWKFWLPSSYWQKFSLTLSVASQREKAKPLSESPYQFLFSQDKGNFETHLPERWERNLFRILKTPPKHWHFNQNTNALGRLLHRQKNRWMMYSWAVAFSLGFLVFHKLNSKRFWPLLFITISTVPFAVAAAVNRNGQHQSNNSLFSYVGSIFWR